MTADERAAVEFAMRQGDRCRNYGPEHERTENENCIVTLADEVERLRERIKDHEQFRHQHRDCDRMGIAIHQARLILNKVQSRPDVPVVQEARPIARCDLCKRVADNKMAGQRCFMQNALGDLCTGTLLTVR